MTKSKTKTIIKSFLIIIGICLFLTSFISPALYHFGTDTVMSPDSISVTDLSSELYRYDISFHYFASGKQYGGVYSFEGLFDENPEYNTYNVKYSPLFPSLHVVDINYKISFVSFLPSLVGLILIIFGSLIKTTKKIKKETVKEDYIKKNYCPGCKCEIDNDSIFCSNCGRKVIM